MTASALRPRPSDSPPEFSTLISETRPLRSLDESCFRPEVGPMHGTSGPLVEPEIVNGIRRGDHRLFDALCLAYHDALWRFAFSILRSREEAQDVVQDVLLSVWERRSELTITTSLASYLFGAVRRRALVYLRNERTSARIAARWAPGDIPGFGEDSPSPQQYVEQNDVEQLLSNALAVLSPVRRDVIALRWGQRMDYTEIADAMDLSVDAVRAHVSRAYRALREVLMRLGVDPP